MATSTPVRHAWRALIGLLAITGVLFGINALLLAWRLAIRMMFTGRAYGWREAFWSLPRFVIGNFVALAAIPRAFVRYIHVLRGGVPAWDKTSHHFPDLSPQS